MSSLSVVGAAQVLRPPEEGLASLRGGAIAAQGLDPGGIAVRDGVIAALEDDPGADVVLDGRGCAVLPGLVDCHTHLPFAAWRAGEYELKLRGAGYEEISRSGGGIAASARALAEAPDGRVLAFSAALADEMLAAGTTALECKSGYGLSRGGELRALRLARELGERVPQATASTALLAHAVPPGLSRAEWMDEVEAMVGDLEGVAALDIFVESFAFSNADLERIGALAAGAGLDLRSHVEQFSSMGSVPVALAAGARSVDHLSTLPGDQVAMLAAAQCAAVLLPAAEFLGAEHRAPGRALVDAGALVVLATDFNPGTAPVLSLPVVLGLAARLYGFSARETLAACTLNAAWVLRMERDRGSLEAGKRGDVVVVDGPVEEIAYRFGRNPVAAVILGGRLAWVREDFRARVRS